MEFKLFRSPTLTQVASMDEPGSVVKSYIALTVY